MYLTIMIPQEPRDMTANMQRTTMVAMSDCNTICTNGMELFKRTSGKNVTDNIEKRPSPETRPFERLLTRI
jgi:hypothetical protein